MPDARSSAERLFAAFEALPDKAAVEFAGRVFTYGEIGRLASRFAAGLAAFRVLPGDTVAIRMATGPETVVALLGILRSGAVHVPLNPALTEEETLHVLSDSGAKLTVARSGSDCPYDRHVTFDDVLAAGREAGLPDGPLPGNEAIALLLYTSGTTGKSKGVELSVGAVVSNLLSVTSLWRVTERDRLAIALPLFHIHGLGLGVLGSVLHGATVLLFDGFDPASIVSAFASNGATVFMGVPTMYVRLLEHVGREPAAGAALSKARLFTSGSAPLPAGDFAAFRAATSHAVLERYGMTETFFTLSNPYEGERRPGSVGLPVPGCEIRIVDDAGSSLPDGEAGELVVKSNGMLTRYRNRPEETAASFRDGWFLTGDVAARSPDGYVTLHGRKSVDFVKSGGYRISAREIEEILKRHPQVRDVAVVGLPDRVWGQRVAAAVVAAAGADVARLLGELRELAAISLAPYKQPREIVVLPEVPRTPLGKVQKNALAAALAKRDAG
jgi:acyl-CoA synthetase (AMP-forming)/AMP-acid ligase II